MLRFLTTRSPFYKFSTKAFDVAVIGGGPGGNSYLIQDMLPQLKPGNLD